MVELKKWHRFEFVQDAVRPGFQGESEELRLWLPSKPSTGAVCDNRERRSVPADAQAAVRADISALQCLKAAHQSLLPLA